MENIKYILREQNKKLYVQYNLKGEDWENTGDNI